jgi:hypothetical protein
MEYFALKHPDLWSKHLEANSDEYGATITQYVRRWARLMEAKLAAEGKLTSNIVQETSREADTCGLTGAMFSQARRLLAAVWKHGDQLNRLFLCK